MRYILLIDADDTLALDAANELFTNVVVAPSPDQSHFTEIALDATDDALDAYLDRFALDRDERDDVFTPIA